MNVFSEKHKVVLVTTAVADPFVTGTGASTDIVNMENYKKCTFIVITAASAANNGLVTVDTGADATTCTTATVFKYRTQVAVVPGAVGSDVASTLTTAAVGGFNMTASKEGGIYIIEVDAADVAAAGTAFDHVCLNVDDGGTNAAMPYTSVIAILSEPRYPQDILVTAID